MGVAYCCKYATATVVRPTLSWNAAAGANRYVVGVSWYTSGAFGNFQDDSPTASYTPTVDLPDVTSVEVYVRPYYDDPQGNPLSPDIDGAGIYARTRFVVDTAGTNLMTVSGTITSDATAIGPITVSATANAYGSGNWDATTLLSEPGPYTLEIFRLADCDGSSTFNQALVQAVAARASGAAVGIDSCADVSADIALMPNVALLSPTPGATGVSQTPVFEWEGYADTYLGVIGRAHV